LIDQVGGQTFFIEGIEEIEIEAFSIIGLQSVCRKGKMVNTFGGERDM
jgi:hypothetical protein